MRDPNTVQAEAEVVADLARMALDPDQRVIATARGPAILLVNDGKEELRLVDEVVQDRAVEGRIVQNLTLETEESLIEYAKRFKGASSLLLASISSNAIVGVLDYHQAQDGSGDRDAGHGYGAHVATLALPFSLEWKEWTGQDGKLVPQLDFVRFLEDCREDIESPDAATVLEACRDLQALRKVDFKSAVREESDNVTFSYSEETDTRSRDDTIKLPAEFTLSIPVYFGGPRGEVIALLRWKLDPAGGLTIGVKLKRAERIRQAEFKRIVTAISEETSIPAVFGSLAAPPRQG